MGRCLGPTVLALGLFACQSGATTAPGAEAAAGDETATPRAGNPCELAPGEPRILDEHGKPIDMRDEASMEAAAGRPMLLCALVRQELGGRVLDEQSRAPVAGASVVVETWQTPAPIDGRRPERRLLSTVEVASSDEGWWRLPAVHQWMPGTFASDGAPYFVNSYCVRADGYAPIAIDPWNEADLDDRSQYFEIALRRSDAAVRPEPQGEVSRCGLPLGPPL